jgi:Fic family protein
MEKVPVLSDRQVFIVEYARKQSSFQTGDILDIFSKAFSVERLTLVRELAELEALGVLERSGGGRAVAYRISPRHLFLEEISMDEYFSRSLEDRGVKPFFNEAVFALFAQGAFSSEEKDSFERVNDIYLHTKMTLQADSPAIFRREWERLIVELSWKSSEIEGNTYTLLETEALLKDHQHAKGKDQAEAQMILNHKKALDRIMADPNDFRTMTISKAKEVHALLVENMGISADFRKHPVGITGTLYRPLPDHDGIEKAMRQMEVLCSKLKNPFDQAFAVLALLSYIQPFEDGNKRTARILANAILFSHDKSMISYRSISAVEYKKAVVLFYEQNNVSALKKVFSDQFVFAVENYFGGGVKK